MIVPRPVPLVVNPDKLLPNTQNKIPIFRAHGQIESDICFFHEDFNGRFCLDVI